jgi:hypothetical protein
MSEETKPVTAEIRAAYEARMSAIADLRAIDQEIGEGPISEEQRAKIDRANAAVDLNDEKIERGFRKQELEAHSAKLDALVGVQVDAGQRDADDGLTASAWQRSS